MCKSKENRFSLGSKICSIFENLIASMGQFGTFFILLVNWLLFGIPVLHFFISVGPYIFFNLLAFSLHSLLFFLDICIRFLDQYQAQNKKNDFYTKFLRLNSLPHIHFSDLGGAQPLHFFFTPTHLLLGMTLLPCPWESL